MTKNGKRRRHKRRHHELLDYCGTLGVDDDVDPRDLFRKRRSPCASDRKLKQLCHQVAETLDLVLAGEFSDDILIHLHVVAVTPAPDASQLLVVVKADPPEGRFDLRQTHERLQEVAGNLRCEVAASITRKRAPQLLFQVMGPLSSWSSEA